MRIAPVLILTALVALGACSHSEMSSRAGDPAPVHLMDDWNPDQLPASF